MNKVASCAVLKMLVGLFALQTQAQPLPQELSATLSGQAKMRFLGFDVDQATLGEVRDSAAITLQFFIIQPTAKPHTP